MSHCTCATSAEIPPPRVIYAGVLPPRPRDYYALASGCSRTTFVYLIFNAEDHSLLYVGMSSRPGTRLDAHRRKEWWPSPGLLMLYEVVGESQMESRRLAAALEARAIRTLDPQHNIAGKGVEYA